MQKYLSSLLIVQESTIYDTNCIYMYITCSENLSFASTGMERVISTVNPQLEHGVLTYTNSYCSSSVAE